MITSLRLPSAKVVPTVRRRYVEDFEVEQWTPAGTAVGEQKDLVRPGPWKNRKRAGERFPVGSTDGAGCIVKERSPRQPFLREVRRPFQELFHPLRELPLIFLLLLVFFSQTRREKLDALYFFPLFLSLFEFSVVSRSGKSFWKGLDWSKVGSIREWEAGLDRNGKISVQARVIQRWCFVDLSIWIIFVIRFFFLRC